MPCPRTALASATVHLWLTDVEVRCFGDLVLLLDELRDLSLLDFRRVTWVTGPPVTRLRAAKPRAAVLHGVRLNNVPLDAYALWLLSVYRSPPNTVRLSSEDDVPRALHAFLETTRTVTSVEELQEYDHWDLFCGTRDHIETSEHRFPHANIPIRVHLVPLLSQEWSEGLTRTTPYIHWRSIFTPLDVSPLPMNHPPCIAIDMSWYCADAFDEILHGSWRTFDTLLSTLPSLTKVVLGFKTDDHRERFRTDVLDIEMPFLGRNIGYECVMWHHQQESLADDITTIRRFFIAADSVPASDQGTSRCIRKHGFAV